MGKLYRHSLITLFLFLASGIALLVAGLAIQPDRELRTGVVVLSNSEELSQFLSSIVSNRLESEFGVGIKVIKSDFPVVVKLHVPVAPDSEFPYGSRSHGGLLGAVDFNSAAGISSVLMILCGAVILFVSLLSLGLLAFWPRLYYGKLKLTLTPPPEMAQQKEFPPSPVTGETASEGEKGQTR